MKNRLLLLALVSAVLVPSGAVAHKDSKTEAKTVDSGSFAIFVSGRRIGSESFSIQQKPEASIVAAELKIEDESNKAVQNSELRLAPNGDLQRYVWKESSPGKAQTTVEYKDQFLVQQIAANPGEKPAERAFMLPPSTMILDDNFFVHREVLVWRYIATACGPTPQPTGCKLERQQFGVFVPHQQASTMVAVEYRGREKVTLHGAEKELDHFALISEGVEWALWVDTTYKLQRIQVPSENVEVVRD